MTTESNTNLQLSLLHHDVVSTAISAATAFASSSTIPECHQTFTNPRKKKRSKYVERIPTPPSPRTGTSRPKHAKKPDPGAPKITMPCSECGKKFWSWKALFGHMRCHPEREWRGIHPPQNLRRQSSPVFFSSREIESIMTEEEREVADSLVLLSKSRPNRGSSSISTNFQAIHDHHVVIDHGGGRFECSSCKKVFGSHQALGGHRASHKNVKGCFAITKSDFEVEDDHNNGFDLELEHKCGICSRVFSSGQALGGHKRCHWDQKMDDQDQPLSTTTMITNRLDLNLPASMEDHNNSSSSYSSSAITLDLRLGL
ncbi:hypothetical protein UlMin_042717 [Ulmus minor]